MRRSTIDKQRYRLAAPTKGRGCRNLGVASVVCAVALFVVSCSGGEPVDVVARVGSYKVTKQMVDHWAAIVSRSPSSEEDTQTSHRSPRERALAFLISTQWIRAELDRRGGNVSSEAVEKRLKEEKAALVSPGEYDAMLKEARKTTADVVLEIRRELAAKKLRTLLEQDVPAVSQAQVRAYYWSHRGRFRHPERRYFQIVEGLATRQVALRAMRKVAQDQGFGKLSLKEVFDRPDHYEASSKGALLRAIFSAKLRKHIGPMSLNSRYAFFQVTRIVGETVEPLSVARGAIETTLAARQQRDTLPKLTAEWRARWDSQTSCMPGYVVQQCREYQGPQVPEGNIFSG